MRARDAQRLLPPVTMSVNWHAAAAQDASGCVSSAMSRVKDQYVHGKGKMRDVETVRGSRPRGVNGARSLQKAFRLSVPWNVCATQDGFHVE